MKRSFVALLAWLLVSGSAHASVVSLDDVTFGVGSLTLDTATGLEWLDLSITDNKSFDDVAAQLGPGGTYEGFSTATHGEVELLVQHAGWLGGIDSPHFNDPTNYNTANALISLFGATEDAPSVPLARAAGWLSDTTLASTNLMVGLFTEDYGAFTVFSMFNYEDHVPSIPVHYAGVWLHREAQIASVPDSGASWALLCVAVVGLLTFHASRLRSTRERTTPVGRAGDL